MDNRYEMLKKHLEQQGYEGEALSRITNKICRELETLGFVHSRPAIGTSVVPALPANDARNPAAADGESTERLTP